MIIVYPSYHVRHRPLYEIFNGNREPHAEVQERIEAIKASLLEIEGVRFVLPRGFPLRWIERVHDHAYVNYLAEAGRKAGTAYVYPSVFPYQNGQYTAHDVGLRGQYSFDTYTPVSNTTYEAAHGSVMAALTAASLVRRGERATYALCRPPGHHAERSRMGGYCYFNNAAIVANYLSTQGRVVVLDIDVHHGNGTQDIFYERQDVLVVSIHGDPDQLFPYFSGREDERGQGAGEGFTVNFSLPLQTEDRQYDNVLHQALHRIRSFKPSYLVVSVGFDAHKEDPIGRFQLSTEYYYCMAHRISQLNTPSVLIQEGGYNVRTIGQLARLFVAGWLAH